MKITQMLSLGKSYAFTLCIFLFSSFIFGQTTLAEFNFNNAATWNTPNVNNTNGPVSLKFYNESGIEVTPIIDGGMIQFSNNHENYYLELLINTTTYSNISVEWYGDIVNTLFGSGTFSLRHIGATPELIGTMSRNILNGGTQSFTLSTAANNKTEVKLRIRVDQINQFLLNSRLRLDNLKITAGLPNITAYNANVPIPHDSQANETYNTVFGNIQTNSAGEAKTYRIRNYRGTEGSLLNVSHIEIEPASGTTEDDFTIEATSNLSNIPRVTTHTNSANGSFGTFTIRFIPQAEGVRRALIKIYSNGDRIPYSFWVIGGGRSCNIVNTPYVYNSMDPNVEHTLTSNLVASDFVGGTSSAHSPQIFTNITTIYPNTNNLYTSAQASWFTKDQMKTREFGAVDISKLRNVSIEFNVAAFANSNATGSSTRKGVTNTDYIKLSVFDGNNWIDVMELKGSSSSSTSGRRKYAFNPNGKIFSKTFDNTLTTVSNSGEDTGTNGSNGNAYSRFILNIPLSISFNINNFKFRISAKANADAVWLIDDVQIKSDNAEFKTYTAAGAWSPPGAPNANQKIIVEGNLVVPNGLNVCECEVMETGSVEILANRTFTVQGKVINHNPSGDNFIIRNDGNLIQVESGAVNSGDIKVIRNSKSMVRQDATFWSSPVAGQNVRNFSPATLTKRFYIYNELTNPGISSDYKGIFVNDPLYPMPTTIPTNWYEEGELNGTRFNAETYTFKEGWGYSIRVADNWHPTNPAVYVGEFKGEPHNGNVRVPAYGRFTLVGNPYPSNISTIAFFDFNPNVNSIHLWTHRFPVGNAYYDYGYLSVTKFGTAGLPNPETGGTQEPTTFSNVIKVGQGFLVQNVAQANKQEEWPVYFNNYMRITNAGEFYRNFNEPETHKFWLGLYDQQGEKMAQILLGYMEGATNEFDSQIDAKRMGSTPLYSLLDEGKMAIQARSLPFNQEDFILLGFVAPNAGQYTISLEDFTGMFLDGQQIYLKDKNVGIVHNLSESDYNFTAQQGTHHHRFEIIFKKKSNFTLHSVAANLIQINKINQNIEINSSVDKITSIQVFNISGRLLLEDNNINKLNYSIQTSGIEPSIIIVRGITEKGETFNQKFIIN